MTVVVDASAALAWLVPSQATAAGWRFLEGAHERSLIAPTIFDWEVRNVLLSLIRRGAVHAGEYEEALAIYEGFVIEFSEPVADLRGLACSPARPASACSTPAMLRLRLIGSADSYHAMPPSSGSPERAASSVSTCGMWSSR